MEKLVKCEQKTLLNELTQGKELTEQLRNHISHSSSIETRQSLIERILSSYEKALSILSCGPAPAIELKPTNIVSETSNYSFANISPKSEVCDDQDCRDRSPKDVSKKRKTQPRWSEQVKVLSGTAIEGPPDDGYGWRKYGQKDILGANFPRGYYRCTRRPTQGCLATKQVQRSDDDPTIFEVTYRGRHTCTQSSNSATPLKSLINDNPQQNKDHCQQPQQLELEPEPKPKPTEETKFDFGANDTHRREDIFPSFSFPSASMGDEPEEKNIIFAECVPENIFLGNLSLPFMSPTAFESSYFSMSSPCHMNSYGGGGGGGQNYVQTPESELTTSVTNSPVGDFGISINSGVDFDTSFALDNLEFFV